MKKIRFIVTLLITGAFIFLQVAEGTIASAATMNGGIKSKAKKAYTHFLSVHPKKKIKDYDFYNAAFEKKNKSYISYYEIRDLDKNGNPELITLTSVNFKWSIIRIYQYKNGKVKICRFANGKKAVFNDRSTADGWYEFGVCKKGLIHNSYKGSLTSNTKVYKLKKEY